MYELILNDIRTKDDAEKLLEEVNLLLKGIYEGKEGNFDAVLRNRVRVNISQALKEELLKWKIQNREIFLKDLINIINKLKIVIIHIAFEATGSSIDRIHSYLCGLLKERILIDLVYEPQLIGGAVIIYQGEYRDFSFKKLFEKEFEIERVEIMNLLNK